MPRYTVHIEENEDGMTPYEYDASDDPLEAERMRRAAELSYPDGAVWVEDGTKNTGVGEVKYPLLPDEDEEGCYPDNDWTPVGD